MQQVIPATIKKIIKNNSGTIKKTSENLYIVLAAGHGKRIKSERSKMLHHIWGKPSVERVIEACSCLRSSSGIVVTGIKAEEVTSELGYSPNRVFAYQAEQKGTGHAVKCALSCLSSKFRGIIYILPGDMGLLDRSTMSDFEKAFRRSGADMMVMTGCFQGNPDDNHYGRIIRIPEIDLSGASSGSDKNRVFGIKEYRDLKAMKEPLRFVHHGKKYLMKQQELLSITEYNAGVYAFRSELLFSMINKLGADNVQGEIYLTDLIELFNRNGHSVYSFTPRARSAVLGFNNKSVLKEMENIYRAGIYDRLKDIINIEDEDDFFIADEVVTQIEKLDRIHGKLDIFIGKGASLHSRVSINTGLEIKKNAVLDGTVIFGKNVSIGENTSLSTLPGQKIILADHVHIFRSNILKGRITIGTGTRIESPVRITGSDEHPCIIGSNCIIKGTTYIYGSKIEDGLYIEHSVLKQKKVQKIIRPDGSIQKLRYYLPLPEGLDCVSS